MSDQEESSNLSAKPEQEPLPEFTFSNVMKDVRDGISALLFNPELKTAVLPVLFMVETIITKVIRLSIPYTEIDYKAYVEQIEILKTGELNYGNIYGGTGPLVYPAGHIWIYKFMYWATQGMKDIAMGQLLFGYLYLLTQGLVFIIYANINLQPWALYLLVLSKRLHSIYVLRLFNDCFATLFSVLTVISLMYASKWKTSYKKVSKYLTNVAAPFSFSLAISVKMNALLYLPGFLLITYFLNEEILLLEIVPFSIIALVQILIGYQFLFNGPEIRDAYFAGAFNFKRKFLYEWTVNWKFLSEDYFTSDKFHKLLLAAHVLLLVFFLFSKWATFKNINKSTFSLLTDGLKIYKPTLSPNHIINSPELGPKYVLGVLASCNLIGVLVSRSLHYQFLSWYAWSLPFLLYHSHKNFILSIGLYLAHEYCWNVYPSTPFSSGLLLGLNSLTLIGYWLDESLYTLPQPDPEKKDK